MYARQPDPLNKIRAQKPFKAVFAGQVHIDNYLSIVYH